MAEESEGDRLRERVTASLPREIEHRVKVRLTFVYVTRHPLTGEDIPVQAENRSVPDPPTDIKHLLRELAQLSQTPEEFEMAEASERDLFRLIDAMKESLPKEIEHHVKVRIIFDYVTRHPQTGEDVPVEMEVRRITQS